MLTIFTLGMLFFSASNGLSQEYVMGKDFYPIPSLPRPAKAVEFLDPNFNIRIVRVTDKEIDGIDRDDFVMIPEYSRSSPENADGSLLLLTFKEGLLYLYDARTFKLIRCLSEYYGGKIPINVDGGSEARWDSKDPNIFYYVFGMGFYKYNVALDEITLLHDFTQEFPDGWLIQNDGEGEPSWDCRYWAFSIRGKPPEFPNWEKFAIVTYDMKQDRIVGRMDDARKLGFPRKYWPHNTVSISPYGDRVLVEWDEGYEGFSSVSYALDFTDPVPLGRDGHSDMAIDMEGNQVHVIKDDQYDWITMIDMRTGKRTNLLKLPMTGSWESEPNIHISGNNYARPGWVVISTSWGARNKWAHYQIFMLELKSNPRIWRIASTHGVRRTDYYWTETKATINLQGSKIWWGSNWGGQWVDTYQANLPLNWWSDLGGVLKAQLLSFSAEILESAVKLTWKISESSEYDSFELEKSLDGNSFVRIATLKRHLRKNTYVFIDSDFKAECYYRLKQVQPNGSYLYSRVIRVSPNLPEFNLEQNYPNPFNPSTEIQYSLSEPGHVHLAIFDTLGQQIAVLVNDEKPAGTQKVTWNGLDDRGAQVPSGCYFYRLTVDEFSMSKKMLIIR